MLGNSKILKTCFLGACALLSVHSAAQDLLAEQAPLDRQMKAIDSVALQRVMGEDDLNNPAAALYPDWNNLYAHKYDVELPKEYTIDLRHFCMPTPSTRITSNYGYRASFRRMHKGIDVKVYVGDTIRAAFSGKVRIVDYEHKGYGKYIVIRHPNGLETIYGHLSKQLVKEDQIVQAGEVIGLGGNTGRSTGSHLHFETRFLGQAIDPSLLFDFVAQDVTCDFYTVHASDFESSSSSKKSTTARKAASPKKASKVHRVKRGESLSSIAAKYGTTVSKLCKLNGLRKNSVLHPGQILKYS